MERLAKTLHEAASALEELGDAHWAAWLRRDAETLDQGDVEGARSFLGAFGGMGSLNDSYGAAPPEDKPDDVLTLDELARRRIDEAWKRARDLVKGKR